MLKKLSSAVLVVAALLTNVNVTFGASDTIQFAENDEEISRAEALLNGVIEDSKKQELKDISAAEVQQISGKSKIPDFVKISAAKKDALQKVKSYKDLQTAGTFDDAVKMLRDRGYPVDESAVSFYREIDTYKRTKKVSDPVAVVKYFNAQAGLKEKSNSFIPEISFGGTAYAISYEDWTKLTTSEKLLVASNPKAALVTSSLRNLAFQWTFAKYNENDIGDKSDGYRHGIWNALMTRDISRSWAEAFATAHEDKSQAELQQKDTDGFYKYQHKTMDLNNNKIGRDQIQWYDTILTCSDATLKTRIANKMTNKSGAIIWLHL